MSDYKEFQFGWWFFSIMIPLQFFFTYAYLVGLGNHPLDLVGYSIATGTFFFVLLLFFGISARVTDDKIEIKYGIGIIKKNISISAIKSVRAVRTPWYYGVGMRLIPNGWLYNIQGLNAVELKFNDKSGIIRIGSKDSERLKGEIDKRLAM